MLVLTESATMVIRGIGEQPEFPDDAGLRIATPPDGSQSLTVSAAATPQEGDQVLDAEGARVFLEPGAAAILDDKILDAHVDDAGKIEFLLAQQ